MYCVVKVVKDRDYCEILMQQATEKYRDRVPISILACVNLTIDLFIVQRAKDSTRMSKWRKFWSVPFIERISGGGIDSCR